MKDELVGFELAKLAKMLGFDFSIEEIKEWNLKALSTI